MLPLTIPGFLTTIFGFWSKLPSPIKVIIIGLIFGFICFKAGEHRANRVCEQQKAASIAEAIRIDTEAANTAKKTAEEQADKYRKQALEAENTLNEMAAKYSVLPEACRSDPDFIKRLNGIGDSERLPDAVPGSKKKPATGK